MKHVSFLLFYFLLLPLRPWSQSVTLEAFLSPDQPFNFEEVPFNEYTGVRVVEETFSFSAGLRGDYAVSNWLELGASFSYSQRSFRGQFYCHVCDFIVPPRSRPAGSPTWRLRS